MVGASGLFGPSRRWRMFGCGSTTDLTNLPERQVCGCDLFVQRRGYQRCGNNIQSWPHRAVGRTLPSLQERHWRAYTPDFRCTPSVMPAPSGAALARRQRSPALTDAVIMAAGACCCVALAKRSQQHDHRQSWQNVCGIWRRRTTIEFDGI